MTQELLETIERYYNDTLATEERLEFETKLKEDPTFKSQVEDTRALLLGIESQALKEKLNDFHAEMPVKVKAEQPISKVRFLDFKKLAVAAFAIIALGSLWFFNGSSNERLYNAYFSPDPGLPTTMSSSDNYAFSDAMVNYKKGDYQIAIDKWEVLQKKEPQNDTINYFLGVAYLAKSNAEKAIGYLNETAAKQESVFHTDANYYLGLAYLKMDDKENAVKFLKLSNTEQSKKLLEKLD